ncbi:hypothetical protein [Cupriavidus sp. D39]|uniref:hypothetical protein n=1 Tax=Cupriavidus sp. D39 TaxID=2997877 RepID=UPI002271A782|nr:hypothetical protein [Cupriavidus sp. D39]MCY0854300.1 hypothetical protein [Cupriavidus sp. D39]
MTKAYLQARKAWLPSGLKNALIERMEKSKATTLLGGTPSSAAEAIGISPQAYSQWPQILPRRLADRVVAAIARKHLPAALIGSELCVDQAETK